MDEQFPDSGRIMGGNTPEFSVAEISGAIRRTLEGTFGRVRVRGEITEFLRARSGHLYFALKDEGGKLSSVVWRGTVPRLGLKPENGVEVIATGRISSYGERSSYQMVIDRLDYAGEGALLARIERLRLRLAEEGLFDPARKCALPFLPRVIGVVTSPQGAVLHDIRTTIARRFPHPVLVWPVAVQGEGAAEQIAHAIAGFDAIEGSLALPRPDVLIVARGGGSLEDLMAFNDEGVLRAVAACRIPVISAVGHETDTTLIDFVSDCRAPTPTAAAEMAVPVRAELEAGLAQRAARLRGGLARSLQLAHARLDRAAAALPDLPGVMENARRRLDDLGYRLDLALPTHMRHLRGRLQSASDRLPAPHMVLALRRAELARVGTASQQAMGALLRRGEARLGRLRVLPAVLVSQLHASASRLSGAGGRLDSLSPQAVLARGYALVTDSTGRPLAHAAQARHAAEVVMTFADGQVAACPLGAGSRSQAHLDL
ncbi:exodeoxyribonuclease VII large subunit [Komagataeibacter medellinensis]|uniref:Exodeoxyribonuclease 7 large subunit n=1 Tax=Komagataeibacter medellinensis TaxID=1177712 RepID=A0ABQ6VVB0_9PROT|nr:exodeoxyribonuclease VII large subunit [Komagataeibacter medellinensis]KAB8124142.1 exodeoxyribonuclease VII large subunit [Komagataeibacter medellinensis]